MTARVDPRIIESKKAEIAALRDRAVAMPKGSGERTAAEEHLAQLEKQFKQIEAGAFGAPQ